MESNILFTAQSPLGIVVECTVEQWETHVLAGHAIMVGRHEDVANTIRDPAWIFRSLSYPQTRDVYFSQLNDNKECIKVVVENQILGSEVVSAWIQSEVRGNIGEVKYVKSKLR